VRISLLSKILSIGLEIITVGHNGMGADAMIWAYGNDPQVWSFEGCSVNDPVLHEIRLKNWSTAIVP
jgi:hypothetical protein